MKQIFLLLALVLAIPFGASAQVGGVTAELSVDQKHFLPDEDVVVTLKISNRSGQTLDFGKESEWVSFSIQGENNVIVEKLGSVPQGGAFDLLSGQFGTKRFNLAPFFSFHRVGEYKVVATVKIAQWKQEIASTPVKFAVMNGVALPNMPELAFGMPPVAGRANTVPEVRKYVLLKTEYVGETKANLYQDPEPVLYFRLTDVTGTKTLRTYPLGRVIAFAKPEAQLDKDSNLHLIYQEGAKTFSYFVINPDGNLLVRQIHEYTATRPSLRADAMGRIYVAGGARRYTPNDWPAPAPASASPSIATNSNATSQ